MKKFMQKKLKNEKGMTLIELLAVIVILAIIAAIAIPAIGNIIENSRVGAVKSDAINIMAAADIYFTDGNTPTTAGEVTVTELKAGQYLDDSGSFPATAKVTRSTASPVAPAKFSGTGTVGNVTLTFTASPRSDINTLKNNRSNIAAVTTITSP